jgi:hypothetical protein
MHDEVDARVAVEHAGKMIDRTPSVHAGTSAVPANHDDSVIDVCMVPDEVYFTMSVKHSRYGTLVSLVDASTSKLSARFDAILSSLAARNINVFASQAGVVTSGPNQPLAYGWILHSPAADAIMYDQADTTSGG